MGSKKLIYSLCSQYQGVFFNNNPRYAEDGERILETFPDFFRKKTRINYQESRASFINLLYSLLIIDFVHGFFEYL